MYFGLADLTVRESDQRYAFELPPAASAEPRSELLPLADGEINRDRLDAFDIAEELKILLHYSRLTAGNLRCKPDLTSCHPAAHLVPHRLPVGSMLLSFPARLIFRFPQLTRRLRAECRQPLQVDM
jgi:hypothetical protein